MGKKSIRAEKTPPKKSKVIRQMVDFKGNPLSTEQGNPLVSERDTYNITQYGADYSPSVVVNSDSYKNEGLSTKNKFSKSNPAALPVKEIFPSETEVSKSLLGITRNTTQVGLFGNVSSYGLDEKDWKINKPESRLTPRWWYERPTISGNYFLADYLEDSTNSAIGLITNPSPLTFPPYPISGFGTQTSDTPINNANIQLWGKYLNSIIALYLVKYAVKNFTPEQKGKHNLEELLTRYQTIKNSDGSEEFNELYWDKVWLDINQNAFDSEKLPILPKGKAYNFVQVTGESVLDVSIKNENLWGQNGNPNVLITEAGGALPNTLNCAWNKFLFNVTRVYFPSGRPENKGHFLIKTNPSADVWKEYLGLNWEFIRQDLKDWEFTIHPNKASVSQLEKDLKLPYFVLDESLVPDPVYTYSTSWPSTTLNSVLRLPTTGNRVGGNDSISSEVTMSSIKPFRYQPGRISGFTYGVKVSEIGAGPGIIIEWGVENNTDSYMFRLEDGAKFSIVRRSTIPLSNNSVFLENAKYEETFIPETQQYQTIVDQKIMNGDPLSGEGVSGYILNLDTVTMYKIEFGWYGAIGARFYAYIPIKNGDARWVTLHTFVIENQLNKPCLADPFFFFKYRLKVSDSSVIRLPQTIYKFGASYYIDGADDGTLFSKSVKSKQRLLSDPKLSTTKTQLNAIDWTVLTGIKPSQFLLNRNGEAIYNKKLIFPISFSIFSQQDCEVKIIRQKGCPEFAYMNQEGYKWNLLSPSRRLKGKFNINPLANNVPELGIEISSPSTYTATAFYNTTSQGGFRDISIESNWNVIQEEKPRVVGNNLFSLISAKRSFSTGLKIKLERAGENYTYISSIESEPESKSVSLPFTYATLPPYQDGYDIEIDYHRRDQTLLSSINISTNEFFIYWTSAQPKSMDGNEVMGIDAFHSTSIRFGITWPSKDPTSNLFQDIDKNTWGIETPSVPGDYILYDGQKFYEGLPYDFFNEYKTNSLFIEAIPEQFKNSFGLENIEAYAFRLYDLYNLETVNTLEVSGSEGGLCRGLGGKLEPVVLENITIFAETTDEVTTYYLQKTGNQWPSLANGETYQVTLVQNSIIEDITTTGIPVQREIVGTNPDESFIVYLLPIGTVLPIGINISSTVQVEYSIIYLNNLNYLSATRSILVSKIAPGRIPFVRVWIQGRQGAKLGGVWIGQKTSRGTILDPLTPHRCTFSISDSDIADTHGQWSDISQSDGALKTIVPITQVDKFGLSTAPTLDASESSLSTFKSVHTNPRKCGSFLFDSESVNAAGIFSPTDYPPRLLSNSSLGSVLSTYYVPANTNTTIEVTDVFNVFNESVANNSDSNEATFFIAKSLSNHDPEDSKKEVYMTLNYLEQ